jgi:DNA polymerase III subunit delta
LELKPAQIKSFLKAPDKKFRVFLIYGQDEGLVRERGKQISLGYLPTLDDPFAYVELTASQVDEDPARVRDELEAISMMGGDRVIRIRGISNKHTKLIDSLLDANFDQSVLVLEGADLKKTGSLPKLLTKDPVSAVIPCYHDKAQDISALINDVLNAGGCRAAPDAMEYLRTHLGSDRAISRQELDKLVIYLGNDKKDATLADVKEIIGDSSSESVFDVIDAALLGKLPELEISLNKAFFAGENAITFLRLIQGQLKQLHKATCFTDQGLPLSDALRKAAIPPFNQQKAQAQIGRKKAPHFAKALEIVISAELECKTTGYPAETICRRALLRIAMASRSR